MMLNEDEKRMLNEVYGISHLPDDIQSADYVAPHLITKTMVGTPYDAHGGWWWSCACGKSGSHEDAHVQTACPCGVMWKKPKKPSIQKTEITLTNDGDPEKVARKVKAALGVPDINCRKCGKSHSIYGCVMAVCVVCHKPVQMGSDTASLEVPGRYRHEACVDPKKKSQFLEPRVAEWYSLTMWSFRCCDQTTTPVPDETMSACSLCAQRWVPPPVSTPTYDDYRTGYEIDAEKFKAPPNGWAKDLQNEYNRILQKALDSMGLPIPNCPRPSTCAHAEGFPLDSKTWSCVACQREIHATTAKNAKTWGLNGPTDRPQFTPDAFDLFSDELWMEALKRGEHRDPAENRLVFLTLNTMWKDPNYQDTRKKWEATVERMRARR